MLEAWWDPVLARAICTLWGGTWPARSIGLPAQLLGASLPELVTGVSLRAEGTLCCDCHSIVQLGVGR